MTSDLHGRVAVVTGGARGIGAATARALADRGATVVVGDLDLDLAAQVAREVGGDALPLDVAEEASWTAFLDEVERRHGRLDVLVGNAGFMVLGDHLDTPLERQLAQVDVNLVGVVLGTRLAAERMRRSGRGGAVVNVASLAGRIPMPGSAVYSATKAGVLAYSEAVDAELAGLAAAGGPRVRVACVLPSFTATELIQGTYGTGRLSRPVTPDDVAATVLRALDRPGPGRTVPRFLGPTGAAWTLFPSRARPWLRHRFGLDHVFLDVDGDARAAYVERTTRERTRA
ncbi:SDR family NAD(P)-dependent oxidoreductase [Nocardioides litoris]|uniref:SDR family NAD(P)-dependent oxidoreductase n=1 Tax=Nocardioides litoris TaxID=1926648 RepID=UPI001122844A|nr:SDR family NAD(P)-dependent oxidoreductase [Nocardioides litoris]